jgi:mono/diheme cytochrome c family protein
MNAKQRLSKPAVWSMGAIAVAAVGVAAYFGLPALGVGGPDQVPAAVLVAEGEPVYAEFCASCHGVDLEGQPDWRTPLPTGGLPAPPHDETGHTWHHPDQLLFAITKFGGQQGAPAGFQSNMPAFGDRLTDREINAVLAFIRSRWPVSIQGRQQRLSERAR